MKETLHSASDAGNIKVCNLIHKVEEQIILNNQQPERSQEGKKADTEMLPNLVWLA